MTSISPLKNIRLNKINLAGLQKVQGMPKHTNEFSRFFPDKIADTGKDPKGGYLDFIKNDILKPLSRDISEIPEYIKPYQKYDIFNRTNEEIDRKISNFKWALNTKKKCNSPQNIPKLQQYKDYNFPSLNKDPSKVELYKNTYLKSDNISIRYPPHFESKNNHVKNSSMDLIENNGIHEIHQKANIQNYLTPDIVNKRITKFENTKNIKGLFNSNTETYNYGWEPKGPYKSTNNRSSVAYNILSHNNNKFSGCLDTGVMDKKLLNKKKILTELMDLNQVFHNKVEKNYERIINKNENYFKKYTGIFTNICDAANRNGNIIQPFSHKLKKNSEDLNYKNHNRSRSSGSNIILSESPSFISPNKLSQKNF